MDNKDILDKIQSALIANSDQVANLSPKALHIKERLMQGYSFWVQNPHFSDIKIILFLKNAFGISKSQAHRDVQNIKYLLGNVKNASKDWYRHMVIEMCRKAYVMAEVKRDPKAMALAADKIGKYAKLDKDEQEELPWEQLIPPNFEPVADVTVLGIEKIPNIEQHRQTLRSKILAKYDPKYFQEAEEVNDEEETKIL